MHNEQAKSSVAGKSEQHLTHPKYRADIDGLRAIAILLVVCYHAFPNSIQGGFIGVDVFFVISGYLISTIIIGSLERNSFSFIDFYLRRTNRIFPALTIVLAACFVFGWLVLQADEYKQLGKHIAAGAGFISNFMFWSESGYFDNAAETKPLLHLWSLGIEEQFYIVWPLLLWFSWKNKFNFLFVSLLVLFVSFVLNIVSVNSGNLVAAFYSPQTRFWELLVGSVLAYKTIHHQDVFSISEYWLVKWPMRIFNIHLNFSNQKLFNNAQSLLGAMLLFIGVWLINRDGRFPGWWALLPTFGSVLIISAGGQAWLNREFLANRVLVWFGLISFPLYLWHWPLLSFARILVGDSSESWVRIIAVLIAVLLSWLTYQFIEKPIRQNGNKRNKPLWLLVALFLIGFLGFNCFIRDGYNFRYQSKVIAEIIKPADQSKAEFTSLGSALSDHQDGLDCISKMQFKIKENDSFCKLTDSTPNVAIIGDSHANHLFYGFKNYSNPQYNKVIVTGKGGCHPAIYAGQSPECADLAAANLKLINSIPSIKYVFLSANADSIQSAKISLKHFVEGYKNTIEELHKMGKKVIFIIDTPSFKESPVYCARNPLLIREIFKKNDSRCLKFSQENVGPRDIYNKFIKQLMAQVDNVYFYDAYSFFCIGNECQIIKDNILLFGDTNHLTNYGSKLLVDDVMGKFDGN